jgi:hypothetical protein
VETAQGLVLPELVMTGRVLGASRRAERHAR